MEEMISRTAISLLFVASVSIFSDAPRIRSTDIVVLRYGSVNLYLAEPSSS